MKHSSTGDIDIFEETTEKKDLGVWMANTLKPANYVTRADNNANELLGLARRSFAFMDG